MASDPLHEMLVRTALWDVRQRATRSQVTGPALTDFAYKAPNVDRDRGNRRQVDVPWRELLPHLGAGGDDDRRRDLVTASRALLD